MLLLQYIVLGLTLTLTLSRQDVWLGVYLHSFVHGRCGQVSPRPRSVLASTETCLLPRSFITRYFIPGATHHTTVLPCHKRINTRQQSWLYRRGLW